MHRVRSPRSRRRWTAAAAAAGLLLVTPWTPGISPSAAQPAAGSFVANDQAGTTAATVALPTGEHVEVSTDPSGRQTAMVLSPDRSDGGYLTLQIAGDVYVVPHAALGRLADGGALADYDVTALAQHRPPTVGRFAHDRNGRFPMRTMHLQGIDELGQPATGLAMFYLIVDVDNGNRFAYFNSMDNGYRNMAVPVGHYAVIGYFSRQDKTTGAFDNRIVTLPEITVPQRPGTTDVVLDGRTATNTLTVSTPRPSVRQLQDVQIDRTDAAQTGEVSLGYEVSGTRDTISVNSTQPGNVQHGQLHFTTTWRTAAPDGSYTYDVEFPADGYVPDRAEYVAAPDNLATIDATYDANVTGVRGNETRYSFLPWQTAAVRVGAGASMPPAERTEYVTARPDLGWLHEIITVFSIITVAGDEADSYRSYAPGEQVSEHWNAPPIIPGVQHDFGANPGGTFVCTACREGNTLRLLIYPFGDSDIGHVGARDAVRPFSQIHETTDFSIWQGDTQLADTTQALGSIDLPDTASTYHLIYHNTRSAPWWTLSTDVRTEWTFASSAADGSGQLPSGWVCGPAGGTDCGVVPLLFARYDLGTDALGNLAPGPHTLRFGVAQAQAAAASPVTATLDVSYDGGATWTPAPTTAGADGTFTAPVDVPPAAQTDGYVALRLHASDENDSALDQTVLRAASVGAGAQAVAGTPDLGSPEPATPPRTDVQPACADAGPARATCFALVRTDNRRSLAADAQPDGYGPADLQSAYGIAAAAASQGDGQTIGIVDAYDAPAAEADLATYRAQFDLAPCTGSDGCFTKLDQRGDPGPYPRTDYGWGTEISLDLDMVSAACPRCRILLVEADSNKVSDLAAAAETAAAHGADVISNSYGTDEFTGMDAYTPQYRHPGVFVVAASGDYGFTFPQFPAVLPDVAAVGGTSLQRADNTRGWTEQAWGNGTNSLLGGGAGSGCSGYVARPPWQHDPDCLMRSTADLAAVADPDTGVAVYDTSAHQRGWIVVGGTSAASPLIGGMVGLAGDAHTLSTAAIYRNEQDFNDVIGGSTGYCDDAAICTGRKGYDGPTGLGSPNGVGGL